MRWYRSGLYCNQLARIIAVYCKQYQGWKCVNLPTMASRKVFHLIVLLVWCSRSQGQVASLTISDPREPNGYQNNSRVLTAEGETITFTCTSQPDIETKLYINTDDNRERLLAEANSTLTFSATISNHNSELVCYTGLDVFTSVYITVEGPPDASTIQGNNNLVEDLQAFFFCISTGGFPAPIIQWAVAGNSEILTSSAEESNTTDGRYRVNSTLALTPRRQLNMQSLKCEVNHKALTDPQISEINITVGFCPDEVELPCPNSILNGTEHVFTCETTEGYPRPGLLWSLEDEDIPKQSTGMNIDTDSEYGGFSRNESYTTLVTVGHNGKKLQCRVRRRYSYSGLNCRDTEAKTCVINVQYQPIISVQTIVELEEGAELSITCSISANPEASSITWANRDGPLGDESLGDQSSDKSNLTINPVKREHAGMYSCRAINTIGDSVDSVAVYIYYIPTALPSTNTTNVYERKSIRLICDVEAQPLAIIKWYYPNDTQVEENGRVTIVENVNKTDKFRPRSRSDLSITDAVVNVDDGLYRCEASNSIGTENIIFAVQVEAILQVLGSRSRTALAVTIVIVIVVLAIVVIIAFEVRRRRRRHYSTNHRPIGLSEQGATSFVNNVIEELPEVKDKDNQAKNDRSKPQQTTEKEQPKVKMDNDAVYANITANFAFSRDKLDILSELGQGAFGRVLLAKATGIMGVSGEQDVAVKTLKDNAPVQDKEDLIQEVELMKMLKPHPNVVRLLGCCMEKDPIYVIVEYMDKGNLKIFLRRSRSKDKDAIYGNLHGLSSSLTLIQLNRFAEQVAKGMEYLSSQKCIHRDLAARNVLINSDLICKVSDFGLARDVMNVRVYQRKREEFRLPIRWMALESIAQDTFTTESDVWGFGILLWEIITLGARPYPGTDTKDVISGLKTGLRMPCPKHCPPEIYKIMHACWETNPTDRPSFKAICTMMHDLLESESMHVAMDTPEESLYGTTEISLENEKL